ncbi:MAG: AEC family transporter [Clostridia bacterium]|nr:AEC family transporter [Clostridia bacterium]
MDSLIFALSAVAPIVLSVIVGYFFKKIGMMDESFAKKANKLVFRAFMPVMLFVNIYKMSLSDVDLGFIGYCLVALLIIFALSIPACMAIAGKKDRVGVLVQAIFRSGYSLIGIPLAGSLYGDEGMMAATILSAALIPCFNVLAVISLSALGGEKGEKISVKKIILDIVKNPLIIGIFAALVCVAIRTFVFEKVGIEFRLSDIGPLFVVLQYLANLAIPLALLVLGAQFEFSAVAALKKEIIFGTLVRTVIVPAIVLGVAFIFFRDRFSPAHFATLVAAFATPVAVPSVPMVQEMGGDVTLAGQLVVWSTLVSAITVFLVTFLLRMGGAF